MNELRNFEDAFKSYYSEIKLDEFKIEEKDIEDIQKEFDAKGKSNVDSSTFQETILMKKIIEQRVENLKKSKDVFYKSNLNMFIPDKDVQELYLLFDISVDSLSKVDVIDLSKDEIFKKFTDIQEKLDKKMNTISISYVNKLVEEVKQSNDYATFASAKQAIEKANLPKEAIDIFNALTANYNMPATRENENQLPAEQSPVVENVQNNNENVVDGEIQNAEQQAIRNNEGSLGNNNNSNQTTTQTLEQRINGVENNSTVEYGARVNEQINEFNIDMENQRIEKLKQLREKKGKLSMSEAIELRTLVEKRELRRAKDLDNSLINKAGDVLLSSTNRRLERAQEKYKIAQQKYNVSKSFISKLKMNRLKDKIAKLKERKGSLTSFQINNAMFSRDLSEKLLTAHAVVNNVSKRFVSVKDKVMSKFRSNPDIDIILRDAPTIIDIPLLDYNVSQSRTL